MALLPYLLASDEELRRKFQLLRTAEDVADMLEVPWSQLGFVLYEGRSHYPYRRFVISKRNGKHRSIDAPHQTVKILQRKLLRVLSLVVRPRSSTHGFTRDRSIVTNALPHVGKDFILNVDLSDFFPSITFRRVRGVLLAHPYDVPAAPATVLAQLSCNDGHLPQGAPTSLILSNIVCFKLDGDLRELARRHRWFYTRYADDMTFSPLTSRKTSLPSALARLTPHGLTAGTELEDIIERNDFRVNDEKLRLSGKRVRQVVTGLTVNDTVNVSRTFVRNTRAMIHNARMDGVAAAEHKLRKKHYPRSRNPRFSPPSFVRVLQGRLDYISMVKGQDDPVYRGLAERAYEALPDDIAAPARGVVFMPPHRRQRADWTRWAHEYGRRMFQLEVRVGDRSDNGSAFPLARGIVAAAAHTLFSVDESVPGERRLRDIGGLRICLPPSDDPVTVLELQSHPRFVSGNVDIALIAVPTEVAPARHALPVRLDPVEVGEEVAVIGYPTIPQRQPALSLSPGTVESLPTNYAEDVDWIQVTCAGGGGMSGSAVIDACGAVVGIVSEETYEKTAPGVHARAYVQVLPIRYALDLALLGS